MNKPYRAILTGATGGIGQAVARELAPLCQSLLLVGRDAQALHAMRLNMAHPGVHVLAVDLAQESAAGLVARAAQEMGGINLLINNAGQGGFHAHEQVSPDTLSQMMQTNLLAPMRLCQTLTSVLQQAPRAQIVNVGSIMGHIGYPGYASYCATKFGLRGFSQALRRELADTAIEVKYFAPRATRTSLNSDAVVRMNEALGNATDSPGHVARELIGFLDSPRFEKRLGWPERFFVQLNQMLPGVVDKALRKQLPRIQQFLS
jgi:short-subunit dehydrogenase